MFASFHKKNYIKKITFILIDKKKFFLSNIFLNRKLYNIYYILFINRHFINQLLEIMSKPSAVLFDFFSNNIATETNKRILLNIKIIN